MNDKIILVTGASRGLGRCIALTLAKEGYTVLANYNKSEKEAKELLKIAKNNKYKLDIYKADVTKREDIDNMINYIIDKYKRIDVLINNAGVARPRLFTEIRDEDLDYIFNGNFYSMIRTSQAVIKYMKDNENGNIINISSIYGITGAKGAVLYASSKACVDAFTKSLAKEVGEYNIRVNSIAPGVMNTDLNNCLTEEDWQSVKNESPLKRITNPEDIAKCILFLIEDTSTTGQVISINAGTMII